MKIPEDYLERVYAGWLGKVIGIRLGAAVEGWTYEKIRQVFGELWDYPAEYKNFSADDDSNGPLFFVRALEDCGDVAEMAEALAGLFRYSISRKGSLLLPGCGRGVAELRTL